MCSCREYVTGDASCSSTADRFASRCRSQWERTGVFLLTGRARVDGGDFLFEGRFALWGDAVEGRIRGDLCGPDGLPVLSWAVDSAGATLYMPREEAAFYHPGGLCAGGFHLPVYDLLFLVRTGFPVQMEAWQIVEGALCGGSPGAVEWIFTAEDDTMSVALSPGSLFPGGISWPEGGASILSSSIHDEYQAWPASWRVESGTVMAVIEISSFNSPADPWSGLWLMEIPIPLDTVDATPALVPAWSPAIR